MSTFESFRLCAPVAENLARQGFVTPTPIQAEAIPAVLEGRDVVGLAQTGTGKTAAFVLPMLHKLCSGPRRYVRALIISPTRELAEQINEVVHQLGRGTQLHTALIFGGVSYRPQFDAIRRGAEIVVACPGRLLDHLGQGTLRLDRVDILVLDEADQMFDMGFLPDIKEIIKRVSSNRQTLLFSATMPSEIRRLAQDILRDPVEIKLAHAPVATVSHALYPCRQENKSAVVIELLRRTDAGPVLIFARTRHRTTKLCDQLNKSGFRAAAIEGGLTQNKRKRAMDGFRTGQFQILVATDVAARGIDVSNISHVINYDMPSTIEAYTHRIGRTGRAAKTGDAYTLVTRDDTAMIRQIERALKAPIEKRYLENFDPNAADQQRAHAAKHGPKPPDRPRRNESDEKIIPFSGHKKAEAKPAPVELDPQDETDEEITPDEAAELAAVPPPVLETSASTDDDPIEEIEDLEAGEPADEKPAPAPRAEKPREFRDNRPPRKFDDRAPRSEGRRDFPPKDRAPFKKKFDGPGGGFKKPFGKPFGGPRKFDDRGPRSFEDRPPRQFDDRGPRNFEDRPPRRDFGDRPPFKKKFDGPGGGFKKPFAKPFGGPRKFDDRGPRSFEDRPPRQFDDRGPRSPDDRPRRQFGDRPPFKKKFDGPGGGYGKKPYGDGGGFKKPFAKKAFHGEYRPAKTNRKPPGIAPTMTGAAPFQKPDKKHVPFWQKKFGKRDE